MILAVVFLAVVLAVSLFILTRLPRRDRSLRSKEKALRIVTPADQRAARQCLDIQAPTGGGAHVGRKPAGIDREKPPDARGGVPTVMPARSFPDGPPAGVVQTFGPRKSGYEFGQFDHPPTIDYESTPEQLGAMTDDQFEEMFMSTKVATPSESSTPLAVDEVLSPQQSAEGEASAAGGQSGGDE